MKRRVCCVCNVLKVCRSTIGGRRACQMCKFRARPERRCDVCGKTNYIHQHRGTGKLLCRCCYDRRWGKRSTCVACGRSACKVTKGRCKRCYLASLVRCGRCKRCGKTLPLVTARYCKRCSRWHSWCKNREERLVGLLGGTENLKRQPIGRLFRHLIDERHPADVLRWTAELDPRIVDYLQSSNGAWSEEALEQFRGLPGGRYLLISCRRAGVIAWPVADYSRVEHYLERTSDGSPAWVRVVLRQYWTWMLKPTIASRAVSRVSDPTLQHYKRCLRIAFAFLAFVASRGLSLSQIHQADVDAFVCEVPTSHKISLKRFLSWCSDGGMTGHPLFVRPAPHKTDEISRSSYFRLLRRTRTDGTLPEVLRTGMWLLLLSARYLADILRLKPASVFKDDDGIVRVRFRRGTPWPLEGELATLLWERRSRNTSWLFPSPQQKGRAMTATAFRLLMRSLGIRETVPQMRMAALRELVIERGVGESAHYLGACEESASSWRQRFGASRSDKAMLASLGQSPPRIGLIGGTV
jgi:hypothetical protein